MRKVSRFVLEPLSPETENLEYALTLEYYVNGFNIIRAVFLIGD